MILHRIVANNFFSYKSLDLTLTQYPVVQVYGINKQTKESIGVGKTSIFLIISEVLYSKNISGIRKSLITNLNSNDSFSSELYFENDHKQYKLEYSPNATKLYENDNLKITGRKNVTDFIESIIPYNLFIEFSYLSPVFRGTLFTGTDSEKKNILQLCFQDLLNFTKYHDASKKELKTIKNRKTELKAVIDSVVPIEIPEEKPLQELPEFNFDYYKRLKSQLEKLKVDIEASKKQKDSLKVEDIPQPYFDFGYYEDIKNQVAILFDKVKSAKKLAQYDRCPTCGSKIKVDKKFILGLEENLQELQELKLRLDAEYNTYKKQLKQYEKNEMNKDLLSKIPEVDYSELESLQKEYNQLEETYYKLNKIKSQNKVAEESNLIRKNLLKQKEAQENQLIQNKSELEKLELREPIVTAIVDALSPNGIIAVKLPERLNILATIINGYLKQFNSILEIDMSVVSNKIVIEILKGNKTFTFNNCSGGERSLVSLALVLGFKKLFPDLTTNILFLDEIVSSLDQSIRKKLIEILAEENLNSYIISHDSLESNIPMLYITKDHEISNAEWILENFE